MEQINRSIRFYQPNDPYFWEVDNLPLTDLLSNDVILENRLKSLEDRFGPGGGTKLEDIADLKAYVEPLSGIPQNFGRVFVKPGKFTSRMQLPATRESGWRMMRDKDDNFNNSPFGGTLGLDSTSVQDDFVRASKGVGRTAVVEFTSNVDLTDKSIAIESFDPAEFNSSQAPEERLDLIYIRGSKALDTNYESSAISEASIGIIKGAYFRTDAAGGVATNGPRFLNEDVRNSGRTTGMSITEIPVETTLTGYGTVPMPEDLANFAWHKNQSSEALTSLIDQQVETQALFTLPVAYVRVPVSFQEGSPLNADAIIDIRPFLRSAEMTYNERAAVAASVSPNGFNPFVTLSHMQEVTTPLESSIQTLTTQVEGNTGRIASNSSRILNAESNIDQLTVDVRGTASSQTAEGLNHEGRLAALENVLGGANTPIERHKFLSVPYAAFEGLTATLLGTETSPVRHDISLAIPSLARSGLVAVQFRVVSHGGTSDTGSPNYLKIRGGVQTFRTVNLWGVAQSNGDLRRNFGSTNTFYGDIDKDLLSNNTISISFETACTGTSDVSHSIYIDGYIVREYLA